MSKTVIKKVRKENPFIMLDKTCVNEIKLSWSAKGLHTYIMGLPDDWNIYLEEVSKHSRETYEATIKTMDELILYGFAKRERIRNDKGQLGAYEYLVFEEPINVDDETIKVILNKSIYKKSKVIHGFKKSDYIDDISTVNIENTTTNPTLEIPTQVNQTKENPKLLNNNQLNNNLTKYVFDDEEQKEIKLRLEIYKDATNKKINQGVKKLIEKSLILSNELFYELAYKSSCKNDCFSYLKTCIENCISDNKLTLDGYKNKTKKDMNTVTKSKSTSTNNSSDGFKYKKTKFDNFDATYCALENDVLDDMIEKMQEKKFA